jgi:lysophospholipase L1-like esterase
MRRFRPASLTAVLLGAVSFGIASAAATAPEIDVFGDSYSQVPRGTFPNWVTQLKQSGKISGSNNFAKSGATAATVGTNTFARQIRGWRAAGGDVADRTVVFLGINDIKNFGSLAKSRAGYKSGVKTLHDAGANLILVQPHDLGTVPLFSGSQADAITAKTKAWNSFVRSTARTYDAVTVDLFRALGNVPASLYSDNLHLNQQGQAHIARAIAAKLGGGARVASSLSLGEQVRRQAGADVQAGLAFAEPAAGEEGSQLGLTVFPIGEAALPRAEAEPGDPTRTQFAEAYAGTLEHDGGIGLDYALPGGLTLGVTIASYGEASRDRLQFGSAEDVVRSDLVGLRLGQRLGALTLETRLSYGDERHETARFDDLTGRHDRASFNGRTLELAQRVGRPVRGDGFTLTPWAELAYERQEVDRFTLASPYLADQTYETAPAGDTLGSLGVDLALAPIAVGEESWLTLSGGLSYTHGLAGDDYRIRVEEVGLDGARDEIIERAERRSVGLSLAASLALGERLAIDGGLALEHDREAGSAEAARVALTYRF